LVREIGVGFQAFFRLRRSRRASAGDGCAISANGRDEPIVMHQHDGRTTTPDLRTSTGNLAFSRRWREPLYVFAGPAWSYAIMLMLTIGSIAAFALIAHPSQPYARANVAVGEKPESRTPISLEPTDLAVRHDARSLSFSSAAQQLLLPVFAKICRSDRKSWCLARLRRGDRFAESSRLHRASPTVTRTGVTLFTTVAIFGLCMIAFAFFEEFLAFVCAPDAQRNG